MVQNKRANDVCMFKNHIVAFSARARRQNKCRPVQLDSQMTQFTAALFAKGIRPCDRFVAPFKERLNIFQTNTSSSRPARRVGARNAGEILCENEIRASRLAFPLNSRMHAENRDKPDVMSANYIVEAR